jgi:hypothetical protein
MSGGGEGTAAERAPWPSPVIGAHMYIGIGTVILIIILILLLT